MFHSILFFFFFVFLLTFLLGLNNVNNALCSSYYNSISIAVSKMIKKTIQRRNEIDPSSLNKYQQPYKIQLRR